jgi:hypothetical protein
VYLSEPQGTKEYAVNENMTDDTAKDSARRRLVRGVFAAPAALTLFSGSVAAASVTCIAKQLTNPITTNGDSTLVRVPLWGRSNGTNSVAFVRYDDVGSLSPPGGSYLTAGQSQCVAKSGTFTAFDVGGIYPTPAGLTIVSGQYAAVRVSAAGRIEGVIMPNVSVPGVNTALHTSCWTSFGGLAPFNTNAPLA